AVFRVFGSGGANRSWMLPTRTGAERRSADVTRRYGQTPFGKRRSLPGTPTRQKNGLFRVRNRHDFPSAEPSTVSPFFKLWVLVSILRPSKAFPVPVSTKITVSCSSNETSKFLAALTMDGVLYSLCGSFK